VSVFDKIRLSFRENLSAQAEDLQTLREQVLTIVLRIIALFGVFLVVTNAMVVIQDEDWGLLTFFIIAYAGILICTFVPKIPFSYRASFTVLIPLGLSITDIMDFGLTGDGMVWLFTSAILTSILFGTRWTIFNWIAQAILLLTFAFLIINRHLLTAAPDFTTPLSWLDVALDYIFLGFIVTIGINILINGLEKSLTTTRIATEAVKTHSFHLERRVNQLRTVAEISRTISAETSENYLQRLAEVIQERLDLYYVGVFFVSDDGQYAVLKAGTGEPGKTMLAQGHQLEIGGNSMISWCITHQQPRIALDVGQEAVRFENPHLPKTHSELALPLKSSSEIIGAVSIQSAESQAFDEDDITVLQGLADSLATAIVNARLFQETQNQLYELNTLYSASLSMYTSVQSQDALLTIAEHMLNISGTQNYVISSWDVDRDEVVTIFGYTPGVDVSGGFGQRYNLADYPLTAKVLNERVIIPLRADDPNADQAEVAILRADGLKTLLMVPLITQDKVIGLMEPRFYAPANSSR
jgi:GAF domain-containing protein